MHTAGYIHSVIGLYAVAAGSRTYVGVSTRMQIHIVITHYAVLTVSLHAERTRAAYEQLTLREYHALLVLAVSGNVCSAITQRVCRTILHTQVATLISVATLLYVYRSAALVCQRQSVEVQYKLLLTVELEVTIR